MSTPLTPEQAAAFLERLSFGERRALRRADYRIRGLKKAAATPYGATLVEAVLAVHTGVLGRPATDADAGRARTALTQPGVRRTTLKNTPAPTNLPISQRSKDARELKERLDAALADRERINREQADRDRAGRRGDKQ
jgi:hypothetical protein